jgi:hypothetical protein
LLPLGDAIANDLQYLKFGSKDGPVEPNEEDLTYACTLPRGATERAASARYYWILHRWCDSGRGTADDHRFTPSEIHVVTGKPTVLHVKNEDATAEEFDSSALKVEKVIAAHASGIVRLRPLAPGRYPFEGEFHDDTAKGVVIAE